MLLWEVLVITIETLRGIQPESGVSTGSMDLMRYGHPSQSEAWTNTVVALTKLLMTELRRRLVKDGVKEEAHICCSVLADLLVLPHMKQSYNSAVAIATAIRDPGSFLFLAPLQFGAIAQQCIADCLCMFTTH